MLYIVVRFEARYCILYGWWEHTKPFLRWMKV